MKNVALSLALLASLVLAIAIVACAGPVPAVPEDQAMVPPTTSAVTPEQILEEMYLDALWSSEDISTRGQALPEDAYAALKSYEEAQLALQELETQQQATLAVVDQYVRAGEPAPNFEHAVLESIEEARLQVLARIGLAN